MKLPNFWKNLKTDFFFLLFDQRVDASCSRLVNDETKINFKPDQMAARLYCEMMTEIWTVDGGQKDAFLRRA